MISNLRGPVHVTKPGRTPEPLEPVSVRDPQCAVDRCLSCTIPPELCSGACGPYDEPKANKRAVGAYDYEAKRSKYEDLDKKVAKMIKDGNENYQICCALGITDRQLGMSKRRIWYWSKKSMKEGKQWNG